MCQGRAMIDEPHGGAPSIPRARRFGDFVVRGRTVSLASTGNSATIDRRLVGEVATWLICYLVVRLCALRHLGRRRASIWFTPVVPHPRYLVRIAAIWAGIRLAPDAAGATVTFFFDDATTGEPLRDPRAINARCIDIRKSHVAAVFERVFGYPLAVDPTVWAGEAVEKSETNGRHDGRIVDCPTVPRPGRVYQRLVDTVVAGVSTDLRTHIAGGRVVAVCVKRRAASARFLPPNTSASLRAPEAVFDAAEIALIEAFAAAMGADWAGLDVLRDRATGRVYVVDVNKTDAGPVIALPLSQKLRQIAILAGALTTMLQLSSAAARASIRARSVPS